MALATRHGVIPYSSDDSSNAGQITLRVVCHVGAAKSIAVVSGAVYSKRFDQSIAQTLLPSTTSDSTRDIKRV